MSRCRLFMATVIRQANQDLIQYNVATEIDMMFTPSASVNRSTRVNTPVDPNDPRTLHLGRDF